MHGKIYLISLTEEQREVAEAALKRYSPHPSDAERNGRADGRHAACARERAIARDLSEQLRVLPSVEEA